MNKRIIPNRLIQYLIFSCLAFLSITGWAKEEHDKYEQYIRQIHTYESFKRAFPDAVNRDIILTPENYEILLKYLTEEYTEEFSLEEMEKIHEFCQSEVGKKWLKSNQESKAVDRLFSEIFPVPESWTCPEHTAVATLKPGKCPICFKDLVKHKEDSIQVEREQQSEANIKTSKDIFGIYLGETLDELKTRYEVEQIGTVHTRIPQLRNKWVVHLKNSDFGPCSVWTYENKIWQIHISFPTYEEEIFFDKLEKKIEKTFGKLETSESYSGITKEYIVNVDGIDIEITLNKVYKNFSAYHQDLKRKLYDEISKEEIERRKKLPKPPPLRL